MVERMYGERRYLGFDVRDICQRAEQCLLESTIVSERNTSKERMIELHL